MRLFKIISLASLIALSSTAAHAVDLLTVPTSSSDALPVADAGFDWNGFYAGVYGIGQTSPVGGGQLGLGVDVGANARLEFVLVGGEVAIEGLGGGAGTTAYVQGLGKAGIALTDTAILYGTAGAGFSVGNTAEADVLAGAGVELAVANNVSLDARYLHGFPITGANPKDQISIGANFHF